MSVLITKISHMIFFFILFGCVERCSRSMLIELLIFLYPSLHLIFRGVRYPRKIKMRMRNDENRFYDHETALRFLSNA